MNGLKSDQICNIIIIKWQPHPKYKAMQFIPNESHCRLGKNRWMMAEDGLHDGAERGPVDILQLLTIKSQFHYCTTIDSGSVSLLSS